MVKYRKIPPAAAANQIAENARIPPAADLQKNKYIYLQERKRREIVLIIEVNIYKREREEKLFLL